MISLALITYFDLCRSSLKFNLSGLAELGGWERGAGVEYSCQSTANCPPASLNTSGHCEGVRSSTLLRLEYGPENIRLSHQVTIMMVNKWFIVTRQEKHKNSWLAMLHQSVRFP